MPSCTANTVDAAQISWETEIPSTVQIWHLGIFVCVSHLEGPLIGTSFTCDEDDIYHEMVDSTGVYLLCIQVEYAYRKL